MAKDHFVSQVHLRKFYCPSEGGLIEFDKDTCRSRIRSSKSVCWSKDGNTSEILTQPRLIEEALKIIENGYNNAVAAIASGKGNAGNVILVIAGFAAYIISCSPTAIRRQKFIARQALIRCAKIIDDGKKSTNIQYEKTFTEQVVCGEISISDEYLRGLAIYCFKEILDCLGSSHWQVLINENITTPFFTSDYPVANELCGNKIFQRVFPLTPTLAVRIITHNHTSTKLKPLISWHKLTRQEALSINRGLVRSAEQLVFANHTQPWTADFIRKNRDFRLEIKISHDLYDGYIVQQHEQAVMEFLRPKIGRP